MAGRGFVTPAGIGVIVPPRGGESLPSPLQVKLGAKVPVSSTFGFISHSFFFFFFGGGGLWQEGGEASVSSDQRTVQKGGGGALLCFDLLLLSVEWVCGQGASLLQLPRTLLGAAQHWAR